MFNIVCTVQCRSLEGSVQSTDRESHRTNCCPNLCFWYTSECHGLQQQCQESIDLKVRSELSTFMRMSWISKGFSNGTWLQCLSNWILPCLSPISSAEHLFWSHLRLQSHCIKMQLLGHFGSQKYLKNLFGSADRMEEEHLKARQEH